MRLSIDADGAALGGALRDIPQTIALACAAEYDVLTAFDCRRMSLDAGRCVSEGAETPLHQFRDPTGTLLDRAVAGSC